MIPAYHMFWRLQYMWRRITRERGDRCVVCWRTSCNCNMPYLPYKDILEHLNYWADINRTTAFNKGEGFIHTNEGYDQDFIYPFVPAPIGPIIGSDLVDIQLPHPTQWVASFVRGGRHRCFIGGIVYDGYFGNPQIEGIMWGTIVNGVFDPVFRYNYPYWYTLSNVAEGTPAKAPKRMKVDEFSYLLC